MIRHFPACFCGWEDPREETKMKKTIAVLLLLAMALCLCACTQSPKPTDGTTAAPTTTVPENTTVPATTADNGKVTYKVTVVDASGNPISGAMVQMCKDSCIPGKTNDQGVAEFTLPADDYKVSFMMLPSGFTYESDVTEFYFEDGSLELTIRLAAAG